MYGEEIFLKLYWNNNKKQLRLITLIIRNPVGALWIELWKCNIKIDMSPKIVGICWVMKKESHDFIYWYMNSKYKYEQHAIDDISDFLIILLVISFCFCFPDKSIHIENWEYFIWMSVVCVLHHINIKVREKKNKHCCTVEWPILSTNVACQLKIK